MSENEMNLGLEEIATSESFEGENTGEAITEEFSAPDELEQARAELEALRIELHRRDELERASARINAELSEFENYFPEVEITEIPDEIWQKVKKGASLAASFALFKRRGELEKTRVRNFNEKNRRMSTGSLMQGEGEKYYSPAEVRKMSPSEVKKNYDDIIESMRHWN